MISPVLYQITYLLFLASRIYIALVNWIRYYINHLIVIYLPEKNRSPGNPAAVYPLTFAAITNPVDQLIFESVKSLLHSKLEMSWLAFEA